MDLTADGSALAKSIDSILPTEITGTEERAKSGLALALRMGISLTEYAGIYRISQNRLPNREASFAAYRNARAVR